MKSALAILLLVFTATLQAQSFEWSRSSHSTTSTMGNAMATDAQGNSVVIGGFLGQSSFGETKFSSAARDIFLVRYAANGSLQWAKRFGSTADDFGNGVAIDAKGDIFITGSFTFKLPMDKDTLSFQGDHDIVIAKLDSKGNVLWAKSAGGRNGDHGTVIAPDAKGNVYVAGYFKDSATFDKHGISAFSQGLYTIFLAKYNPKGQCEWVKPLGGSSYQSQMEGLGLDVDAKGNVYIAGALHGRGQIDTAIRTAVGVADIFIAKYSPSGSAMWVRTAGAASSVLGMKALKVGNGSVYISGNYITGASFDGGKTKLQGTLGYQNVYLARYDESGTLIWAKEGIGRGPKSGDALTLDAKGNVYMTGTFSDSLRFDSTMLSNNGRQDFYAVSFTPNAEVRWIKMAGRNGVVLAHGIGIDKAGNTYYSGLYNDSASFGKSPLVASKNAQDLFITKLSATSPWVIKKVPSSVLGQSKVESITDTKSKNELQTSFTIVGSQYVKIDLYDPLGEIIESYLEQQLDGGGYNLSINTKGIPSGAYYLRVQIGEQKETKRVEL